jgi:predicted SnoaL-like aldol condensation-catalyzing enzyme
MSFTKFVLSAIVALLAANAATASETSDMDGDKTPNGKLAVEYLLLRFNQGKMAEADKRYTSPGMIEHGYLGMMANANTAPAPPPEARGPLKMTMDVKKVLVQGDLVFIQAHGTRGDTPGNGDLMWILYRVKDGKVVEHWDTHNPIPDSQVGKQW